MLGFVVVHDDVLHHEMERPTPRVSIGSQAVQQAAELDELLAFGARAALGSAALDAAEVRARGACRDEDHEIVGCLGSRCDAIQELIGLVDVVATDHLDLPEFR